MFSKIHFCTCRNFETVHFIALLHVGRRCLSSEDAEEERFSAVLMLMEILTNLLSKDFLSFASGLFTLFYCDLIAFTSFMAVE